jgi:hypothetical protein
MNNYPDPCTDCVAYSPFVTNLKTIKVLVGFGILIAVVMKSSFIWDITPCSALKANRRFGGTSPPFSGPKNKPRK